MVTFKLKEFLTLRTAGDTVVVQHTDGQVRSFAMDAAEQEVLQRLLSHQGLEGAAFAAWQSPLKDYFLEQDLFREEEGRPARRERHDLYLDYIAYKYATPIDKQQLEAKRVLVLGAGGGGAGVLYQLAQLGIKELAVADFDTVSETDIRRSMVYRKRHIGQKKTTVLQQELGENFGTALTIFDVKIDAGNINRILSSGRYDLVVNGIDPDPEHKMILNRLCHQYRVPVLFIAYSYEMLLVGPFVVPGSTSCYESYNKHVRETVEGRFDFYSIRRMPSDYLHHPSANFSINMLCAFAVRDILFFLAGKYEIVATWGTLLFLDGVGMSIDTFELNCTDDCPVCKPGPTL